MIYLGSIIFFKSNGELLAPGLGLSKIRKLNGSCDMSF